MLRYARYLLFIRAYRKKGGRVAINVHSASGRGNRFGSNVYIGPDVTLGCNNVFGANCSVIGNVVIGDNNIFAAGVSIGCPPRQKVQKERGPWNDENVHPPIFIGSDNFFEDYVTIQEPLRDNTMIGNYVALGAYTRVCHDGTVRDGVTAASHCAFGGYVRVGVEANVGMGVVVHQRSAIGAWAMLGAGTVVVKHVAPGAVVCGVPSSYVRPNTLGLERAQFCEENINSISMYLAGSNRSADLPEKFVEELATFVADAEKWKRLRPTIPREVK